MENKIKRVRSLRMALMEQHTKRLRELDGMTDAAQDLMLDQEIEYLSSLPPYDPSVHQEKREALVETIQFLQLPSLKTEAPPPPVVAPVAKDEPVHLVLYFDGASKSNPGEAGAGWIALDDSSGICIAYGYTYMGDCSTNNEAEYTALIEGLHALRFTRCNSLTIRGDSKLVVEQVNGNWKCKAANLEAFIALAKAEIHLLRKAQKVKLEHIPREQNTLADVLSNVAVRNKETVVEFPNRLMEIQDLRRL